MVIIQWTIDEMVKIIEEELLNQNKDE